jgi:hypothetical protein
MANTTYQPYSVYYYTPQTSTYLGIWTPPNISRSTTDVQIQLTPRYNNRPDLLSNDLYGTPRLWWTFAMLNPDIIKDPVYDMQSGIQIWVASQTTMQAYL